MFIIPCPMWVLIVIFTLPFLLFIAIVYVLGRVKRKFKIGDLVKFINSTEELVVIDYVRFNPHLVVVQAKQRDAGLIELRGYNCLAPKVHIKYLIGINPVSKADFFARYCADKGIKPIDGTMRQL